MSIFSRRTSVQSLLGVDSHSQGMATPGTGNRRMSAPPSAASVAEAAASSVFTPGPVSSSEAASNHEVYYVRGRPFIAPMAATNRQQQRRPSSLATLGRASVATFADARPSGGTAAREIINALSGLPHVTLDA